MCLLSQKEMESVQFLDIETERSKNMRMEPSCAKGHTGITRVVVDMDGELESFCTDCREIVSR
jgi:hypothetical protein